MVSNRKEQNSMCDEPAAKSWQDFIFSLDFLSSRGSYQKFT
jgi:hypothetical protein